MQPQTVHPIPCDAPLGARIEGVDLSGPLDDATLDRIEQALHAYGVLVFPGQRLDDAAQKAFSLRFGPELDIHPLLEFAKPGNPEVFVLSNIVENGRPVGAADAAQYWHTDLSYTTTPSRVSLLYAIEVPSDERGPLGDTEFAATDLAYRDLDPSMKQRLAGLRAYHDARKPKKSTKSHFTAPLSADTAQRLHQVSHPVVRTHPKTGAKCLYVNEGFTTAIDGMPPAESQALLDGLFQHMVRPQYVYAHKWQAGDLVMWDNCLTIHQGVPNYGPHQRRLMYRTIVKGPAPV
ncbi:MAG: TauD/TfdA dioxygenase family protein [Lautropia sp.]